MAGQFDALAGVTDPKLRAAVKLILDRLGKVEAREPQIGRVTQTFDANGHLVTGVQDPVDESDAVNLRTLRTYIQSVVSGALTAPPERPAPTPIFTPGSPLPPPTPGPGPGPVPPTPPVPPVPPIGPFPPPQNVTGNIRVAGQTLRQPDGSIYKWKSATDFLLLKRYLDGEDITPILADRTGEGATMVRVLGMCTVIASFDPSAYPNYLTSLPAFADVLAAAGLDLEFVVFADAQNLPNFDNFAEQRAHLRDVRDALVDKPNVVLELVNEYFQNGVDPSVHERPAGILSAPSSGTDKAPNLPPWDYATFHAARDTEWPRKAHNAMEVADFLGRPVINDEPMGAAEVAIPGSRSSTPDDFYWFAAVGMLLAGGGTFHSTNGLTSEIWQPVQRACAQAFYAALDVIPASITTGQYTRGPLSDCPIQHDDALALRTYARYNASEAVAVAVRVTGGWSAIAVPPWSIVSQAGPSGSVVFLSR